MRGIAAASESWPSVNGSITHSSVSHSVSSSNKFRYIPKVQYKYEIDGIEYSNDTIQFVSVSWEFKDRFRAERVIKPYSKGKIVDVFYDPAEPENSVLKKGSVGGLPWGYIISSILLLLGLVFTFKKSNH